MTIHIFPTPTIRMLIKSFFSKPAFGSFYSRAMWALADAVKFSLNKETGIIWLPDYICKKPIAPLKKYQLYFYPTKKDLTPNWETLENKVQTEKPDIFILVHYFGFLNDLEQAEQFCQKYGIKLLEDGAHLIKSITKTRNTMILSPRKQFAIPEGGLLIMPNAPQQELTRNKVVLNWLVKRLIQKLLRFFHIPWHKFWQQSTSANGNFELKETKPNKFTLKMFAVQKKQLPEIISKRRQHYRKIEEVIKNKSGLKPFFENLPEKSCPYVFPVITEESNSRLCETLQKKGIPASTWPDLPEEILNNKSVHLDAVWLRNHVLLLPLHQDLSKSQLKYLLNCLT